MNCPISDSNKDRQFIIEIIDIEGGRKDLIIKAPIYESDIVRKYGVKYRPGSAEIITGGIPNWTN